MKPGIHPNYSDATITCACGATHETRSTRGSYAIDVCSQCHPFFTGTERLVDTAGRVDRFPTHFNLRDQGLFALGYYHQRQDLFTKRSNETNSSTTTEESLQ